MVESSNSSRRHRRRHSHSRSKSRQPKKIASEISMSSLRTFIKKHKNLSLYAGLAIVTLLSYYIMSHLVD